MDRSANLDTEELKVGDPPGAVTRIWVGSRPALSAAAAAWPRGRGLRGVARSGARGSRSPGRGARSRAQPPRGGGKHGRATGRAERGFPLRLRGREHRHNSTNNNDDDGHDGGDDGGGAARVLSALHQHWGQRRAQQ